MEADLSLGYPDIAWQRNDGRTDRVVKKGPSYVIENATFSDAGLFKVAANTILDEDSKSVQIIVQGQQRKFL